MSGITLSAGVRQSLSALQSAASQQSTIQNRLATGKKVNSALDNPASFFTASGLNNRASDLSRLLDDMGQSIKTLEAADKGIKAITKLVENAQSIAKQAQSSASANIKATGSAALTDAVTADAGDVEIIIDGATAVDVSIADGDTINEIVDKFNAVAGLKASLDDSGNLQLEALNGESLEIGSGSTAATLTHIGIASGAKTRASDDDNATRAKASEDFDSIREQINQLAKDAGYNGTNLLSGDSLKVTFNEDGTSSLSVKGTNLDSSGLGISASVGDFQANSDIEAAVDELKAAVDTLRTQASTFGANLSVVQNRQDFTKGMIDTLKGGADALVVADPNEEGANLLALQTRAQLASTTLSMASQQDQAVLRLF
jgi:flagellin-like hook-associated protein FlgL